jgi:hypothetical protein
MKHIIVLLSFFVLFSNAESQTLTAKNIVEFVPDGYKVFEEIHGDLNKDGISDAVLIIKAADKDGFVKDEYSGKIIDRNRKGIVIALKKGDFYELVLRKLSLFSSENEDGGVYYLPELGYEITKGNLIFHYAHGRYGYWQYIFRYQNNDFELIGYDGESSRGPVLLKGYSINFLTQKIIIRENQNEHANDGEDEIIKTVWRNFKIDKLYKLSEIDNIDGLNFSPTFNQIKEPK